MVIFLYIFVWIQQNAKKSIQQKWIDYIEKWPFMVIFLYNLYIFVWKQHFGAHL